MMRPRWYGAEPLPGLDFETEAQAAEFNAWLSRAKGVQLEADDATLTVPFGVGCLQADLNEWREEWESEATQ